MLNATEYLKIIGELNQEIRRLNHVIANMAQERAERELKTLKFWKDKLAGKPIKQLYKEEIKRKIYKSASIINGCHGTEQLHRESAKQNYYMSDPG